MKSDVAFNQDMWNRWVEGGKSFTLQIYQGNNRTLFILQKVPFFVRLPSFAAYGARSTDASTWSNR